MATSGNALAAIALVLAATTIAACTSSAPQRPGPSASGATSSHPSARRSGGPTPTTYGGAALGTPSGPCFVPLPRAWKAAMARNVLWRNRWDSTGSDVPMPDGSGVLRDEQRGTRTHVAVIGRGDRIVEDLGYVKRSPAGQLITSAATATHIAFVYSQSNGEAASWRWDLYLWNRVTKRMIHVADNPTDSHGNPLRGGWVRPVLTDS